MGFRLNIFTKPQRQLTSSQAKRNERMGVSKTPVVDRVRRIVDIIGMILVFIMLYYIAQFYMLLMK